MNNKFVQKGYTRLVGVLAMFIALSVFAGTVYFVNTNKIGYQSNADQGRTIIRSGQMMAPCCGIKTHWLASIDDSSGKKTPLLNPSNLNLDKYVGKKVTIKGILSSSSTRDPELVVVSISLYAN